MTAWAYYNEIEPYAAQWLRNLIDKKLIAPGVVDERSIEDVTPDELSEFTQCHFFAGIGVWSRALRQAGWPDDKPVWTGSCPCQPFSSAGKGAGFDDERHLWPAWFHLISQCQPDVVFGEQVASKDGLAWLDLVQDDLAGARYASAAVDLCAAGVGAPHIRQRLWFVAENQLGHAKRSRSQGHTGHAYNVQRRPDENRSNAKTGIPYALANSKGERFNRFNATGQTAGWDGFEECGAISVNDIIRVANANSEQQRSKTQPGISIEQLSGEWGQDSEEGAGCCSHIIPPNARAAIDSLSGESLWSGSDWLLCRDGKWRPVESGTFPLAHGITGRVGRLRAYGNAINAESAKVFIESYQAIYH